MKIEIGRNVNGGPVYLTEADFITHLHILGLSRSGKSMWLLYLIQQLLRLRKQVIVLDPHGSLYRDIIAFMAGSFMGRPVVLFDPSYEKKVVGFNPFQSRYTSPEQNFSKADMLAKRVVRTFGIQDTNILGNIEKYLRVLFFVLLDRRLSICQLDYFLY